MTYQITFTMQQLLEAGVHFGHKKNRWNPKMESFIYGIRNGVHIIDLQKTKPMMIQALNVLKKVALNNGNILFIGTKKQSSDVIAESAKRCGQYFVNHRWLGGMLTNWSTISNSINTLKAYEEALEKEDSLLTKKEKLNLSRKKEKLDKALGGIRNMGGVPDILFVIDAKEHALAIQEANKLNIPIIAVVDTNTDPDGIDYVIPGNDDARKATELYCHLASNAILSGMEESFAASGVDIEKLKKEKAELNSKKKTEKIPQESVKEKVSESDTKTKKAIEKPEKKSSIVKKTASTDKKDTEAIVKKEVSTKVKKTSVVKKKLADSKEKKIPAKKTESKPIKKATSTDKKEN